ncbi:MAG TPA: F0F1 ATP synthase subunit A [Streptosporangiaceae bacterium]
MIGSVSAVAAASRGCHIFSGCGFPSPSLESFDFRPIFSIGSFHFTKPILLALICMAGVIAFFWAAFAKPQLVPRGMQNIGELALLAVRDQIARPSLGKRADTFLPFLTSLFFFIYFCNLMEIIPFFQFPVMSRSGFPWALVAMIYPTYLYLGFRQQGGWGYIRNMIPRDVPIFVLVILIPIELLRYFVVQPFTLGVRLFANMFAGHLLLLIFTLATWYLASASIGLLFAATSALMVLAVFLLELLVQLLQAFIFTTLAATYIADSLEGSH